MNMKFQSTLPRRERREQWDGFPAKKGFNPRSREGNDFERTLLVYKINSFNPRSREGNDDFYRNAIELEDCFNPRSREGNDHVKFYGNLRRTLFQSTLPRRERLATLNEVAGFNSVSIHAPAKGTTRRS